MKKLNFLIDYVRRMSAVIAQRLRRPYADVSNFYCLVCLSYPSRSCLIALIGCLLLSLNMGHMRAAVNEYSGNDIRSAFTSSYASGTYDSGEGFKISSSSGYGGTANQFRVAKSSSMTVASTVGDITKIVITVTGTGYKLNDATNLSWSSTTGTYTASGTGVTSIQFNNSSNNIARISNVAITYKAVITFDANGGTCGTSSLAQSSPTASISLPTPTRDGYTCTGWYTASSGGTKRGNAGGSYTPTSAETLYAQWQAVASCSADPTIGDASINSSFS